MLAFLIHDFPCWNRVQFNYLSATNLIKYKFNKSRLSSQWKNEVFLIIGRNVTLFGDKTQVEEYGPLQFSMRNIQPGVRLLSTINSMVNDMTNKTVVAAKLPSCYKEFPSFRLSFHLPLLLNLSWKFWKRNRCDWGSFTSGLCMCSWAGRLLSWSSEAQGPWCPSAYTAECACRNPSASLDLISLILKTKGLK